MFGILYESFLNKSTIEVSIFRQSDIYSKNELKKAKASFWNS